ncbi:MAG: hypothetical protein ACREV5_24000 [Steroidobacter sp.]
MNRFTPARLVNLSRRVAAHYTQAMWRRVATIGLLWIGLSGLLPAAIACTADMPMPMQECCPDHDSPCDAGAPVTPEQLECCDLKSAAPIAAAGVEKTKRVLIDDLTDDAADYTPSSLAAFVALSGRTAHPPPRELRIDQSDLWLQTARLRL